MPVTSRPASSVPDAPSARRAIVVLAADVADRIAAGEVVERPASVVKELVENALDAGATVVEVEVREGGRALMRVSDDGHGMDRTNAELAIARHATSKIRDADDLVGVRSFGFRGEALPAIGSVSQLTIESATADGAGVAVEVVGGTLRGVRNHARQRGTTVTVAALFFNTPARQKFLRGARSEWRAVADTLTTLALVRRDVRFAVTHDGKEQMRLPAAGDLRTRVVALWGAETGERLVDVDDVQGPIRVSGLVERPSEVGSGSRRVFVTVNGRAVRDVGVVRAAEAAYRTTISAGLRPSVLLEVELPGGEVDVNVHPAKAEVRFRDRWTVERAVERAVRRALGTEESAASVGYVRSFVTDDPAAVALGTPLGVEMLRRAVPSSPAPLFDVVAGASPDLEADSAAEEQILVPPLTQFHRTYISFERPDALVLIDQHAAHERVLYERFMQAFESGAAPSQQLLFPLTLHLTPAESDAFEVHRALFATLGYDAEAFGGQSIVVHAVPAPHPRFDAERCLRDSLAALTGDRAPSAHGRHERLAATVACKAAIKGGDLLALDEMRALYVALARTTLPAHDVHGRATILLLSWDELDRRFGRH